MRTDKRFKLGRPQSCRFRRRRLEDGDLRTGKGGKTLLPVRTVGCGAGGAFGLKDAGTVGGVGAGVEEALPDDLDGCRGRVDQVFRIETVITKLIRQDFVRREVTDDRDGRFAAE